MNASETSKSRELTQQPADSADVMLDAARIFGQERAAPAPTFSNTPGFRYRYGRPRGVPCGQRVLAAGRWPVARRSNAPEASRARYRRMGSSDRVGGLTKTARNVGRGATQGVAYPSALLVAG